MVGTKDTPYCLRPGDVVSAILPAGPPDVEKFEAGVAWLAQAGFQVRRQPGAERRKWRYLAGSDDERAQELAQAYADPDVRALFCGRGGYGTMRLLRAVEPVIQANPPKLLLGFSDVTALGCLLWKYGVPWIHGPLLTSVAAEPDETKTHLLAVAAGYGRGRELRGKATIRPGRAEGRLIGGSLSLLSALCGTPYMPELRGAIVFLEDIGERPYRLDRMWQQLRLAGVLNGIAGLIFGHLTQCDAPDHTGLAVLSELAAELNVPAASGFAFGHEAPNFAVPVGAAATLHADAPYLAIDGEVVR